MLPAITVFDTETTGLDPKKGHRIVEIAGVRIENSVITEKTFSSFVNPERDIPLEAQRINNISNEDVKDAPNIMTVLPEFLEFSKGSILIAHNAPFDQGFLECEKEFCWGYIELPEILCSLALSRSLFPREFRHNLDILCQRFNMPFEGGRHRALPDVIMTAKIIVKMLEHGKISSLDELRKRAGLQVAAGVR